MKRVIKPKYDNDTVLDVLRRQKIFLCADCGGRGTCGKCRIRFIDPDRCPEPTEAEWKLISEDDLARGVRLACEAEISSEAGQDRYRNVEVEIPAESLIREGAPGDIDVSKIEAPSHSEIIAVDYGTTMICGAVVDLNKGITAEASVINHQKAYGADVVSRIEASNDGYGEELRRVSEDDLAELSVRLGRDPDQSRYIISGNTVMGHLISGFTCRGLGEYPYEPVDISLRRDGNLTFLPGVSGFVGADIISGICACSLDTAEAPWLYVDIGTNGEMALGTGGKIFAASAPAGPAFEGGNLSCGMPAVPGAVSSVVMTGSRAVAEVIGGGKAIGICGSGIIDIVAEARRNRSIDKNGTLAEEFSQDGLHIAGDAVVTQNDVREIQKAKAAIRAGMETLISESGVDPQAISKLVIAGSFGSGINVDNACRIGLIPEELLPVCAACGNASLTGATLYALDTGFASRLESVIGNTQVIELSDVPEFPAKYISYMGL